jgi:hypothetical protein
MFDNGLDDIVTYHGIEKSKKILELFKLEDKYEIIVMLVESVFGRKFNKEITSKNHELDAICYFCSKHIFHSNDEMSARIGITKSVYVKRLTRIKSIVSSPVFSRIELFYNYKKLERLITKAMNISDGSRKSSIDKYLLRIKNKSRINNN